MKNKLVTGLISVAVALAIWMYVVTVVSPNSDKTYENVPVITQGEAILMDRGLMVTSTNVTTTTLHLEGSRLDLNKLNPSNIIVTLDVSRLDQAGSYNLSYSVSYPGDVASNAITELSKDPGFVKVTVEERISKTVPLEVKDVGTVAETYTADKENMVKSAESILVTGPKSVVDKIAKAVITLDLEGRSESISDVYSYVLCDAEDVTISQDALKMVTTDVEEVNLSLRIVKIKILPLTLNIVEGGGATTQNSSIVIDPPYINISGSDAALEGLDNLELGTVELGTILEDSVMTFPIKLPDGVVNETGLNEVSVSIGFPDLALKTLTVKNIQAVNVPQCVDAELITQALEITVRGPKAKIEALTEDAIKVTVDLANTESGTLKLKAQIDCGDPELGAVGTYTVSATVKTQE